ncbi:MAG: hypothetical protein V8S08_01745 [Lachnoclostridium sp.]
MKKRSILSLALVVAMVMTSFPVVVAEENVVPGRRLYSKVEQYS